MKAPRMRAVVPVKRLSRSKARLSMLLSVSERRALARAMLEDVLAALAAVPSLAGIVVVTGDPEAAALARGAGALVLNDPEHAGITAAVARAAQRLEQMAETDMLVIPADVPRITRADIEAIIAAHRGAPSVTLVPARADGGTNALAASPPAAIPFEFGEESCRRHAERARACGIEPHILVLDRLSDDIDRPEDVVRFLSDPSQTRTYAYLRGIELAERLQPFTGNAGSAWRENSLVTAGEDRASP